MDWNRAKHLIIIFLIVLNGCLAILIYIYSPKYELTSERENAIRNVLEQNRISLYVNIPKKYNPMPRVVLEPPGYDTDEMIRLSLGEDADITRSAEFDKTIFTDDNGRTLTFTADKVIYENEAGTEPLDFSRAAAKDLCDSMVEQNPGLMPGFELDGPAGVETKSGYRLDYRQIYKNNIIYPNYASFTLNEKGIVRVEFSYKKPLGFDKEKREIMSPDEALFALMQKLLNMDKNSDIIITKMDMVYYQAEAVEENAQALMAEPYYRFWVEGAKAPYLINGYTGIVE